MPRYRRNLNLLLTMQALLAGSIGLSIEVAAQETELPYPETGYSVTEPAEPAVKPKIPTSYSELLPPLPTAPQQSPPPKATHQKSTQLPGPPALAAPVIPTATPTPMPEPMSIAPTTEQADITPVVVEPVAVPAEAVVAEEASPARWYYPPSWFGPAPWDSGIEFGLNGSSGTSESLSFRTGGFIKRKASDYKFNGSLYYNKTQAEGVEIQSNALLDLRYDWLFDDSPWTLYVMSQTFYDEFQAFDFNFNANTGFGYQWFDEEWTSLTTSIGTGASREFGGPVDDKWVAEANFGVNYELKWADNKKFYAKIDLFPEWADFSNYRALADVGFEFELHEPSNMSLKLSATERYDSEPQGADPHNLNYSAMLIWKL